MFITALQVCIKCCIKCVFITAYQSVCVYSVPKIQNEVDKVKRHLLINGLFALYTVLRILLLEYREIRAGLRRGRRWSDKNLGHPAALILGPSGCPGTQERLYPKVQRVAQHIVEEHHHAAAAAAGVLKLDDNRWSGLDCWDGGPAGGGNW